MEEEKKGSNKNPERCSFTYNVLLSVKIKALQNSCIILEFPSILYTVCISIDKIKQSIYIKFKTNLIRKKICEPYDMQLCAQDFPNSKNYSQWSQLTRLD